MFLLDLLKAAQLGLFGPVPAGAITPKPRAGRPGTPAPQAGHAVQGSYLEEDWHGVGHDGRFHTAKVAEILRQHAPVHVGQEASAGAFALHRHQHHEGKIGHDHLTVQWRPMAENAGAQAETEARLARAHEALAAAGYQPRLAPSGRTLVLRQQQHAASAPTPTPKPVPERAGPPAGFEPISGSKHGGYHRRNAAGGYDYWYPGQGLATVPREGDEPRVPDPEPEPEPEPKLAPEQRPASTPDPGADGSGRRVHHDVGEKVGGARKDLWAEVNGRNLAALEAQGASTAYKHCTKHAVLGGAPDPAELREAGDSAGAAMLKLAIWSALPVRPSVPDNQDRKSWLGRKPADAFSALARGLAGDREVPHRKGDPFLTSDAPEARALFVASLERLQRDLDASHTVAEVQQVLRDRWDIISGGGQYEEETPVTTETAAEFQARFPAGTGWGGKQYLRVGPKDAKQEFTFDSGAMAGAGYRIVHRAGQDAVFRRLLPDPVERSRPILEDVVLGKRWQGTVDEQSEAFRKTRYKAIEAEKANDWTGVVNDKGEAPARGGRRQKPIVVTRLFGEPRRDGGPAVPRALTGEDLRHVFGLRAVEYGNWVNDEAATAHLHHAYGALLDLADLLGLEPTHLAHGSKLAIAFGARGSGHANAHYEPDKLVINLTHTRGGGTLAHEWGHFMDHMVAGAGFRVEGMTRRAVFGSHAEAKAAAPGVQEAFRQVMEAIHRPAPGVDIKALQDEANRERDRLRMSKRLMQIRGKSATQDQVDAHNGRVATYNLLVAQANQSKFAADASLLGDYWARPHELFARAFESWAEDRLHAQDRRSEYLVVGTQIRRRFDRDRDGMTHHDLEVYPFDDERRHIHQAIDGLVKALRDSGTLAKAWRRFVVHGVRT